MGSQAWEKDRVKRIARFELPDDERLRIVLTKYKTGFQGWVRLMFNRCLAERLPESSGGVRKIVPKDVAFVAWAILDEKAENLLRQARLTKDLRERAKLREAARPYVEAAAFFYDVKEQIRQREELTAAGEITPRDRHVKREADQASQ